MLKRQQILRSRGRGKSATSCTRPALTSWATVSFPSPSMFMALEKEVVDAAANLGRAGGLAGTIVLSLLLPNKSCGTLRTSDGKVTTWENKSLPPPDARSTPTILGMISPPFSTNTHRPHAGQVCIWSALCNEACSTVATELHGFQVCHRGHRPGPATW